MLHPDDFQSLLRKIPQVVPLPVPCPAWVSVPIRTLALMTLLSSHATAAAGDSPRPAAPLANSVSERVLTTNARLSSERPELRAQLSPRRYTTLAAEIGARISRLPIPEGGTFRQGQTLLAFDCSVQAAQLNKARAALVAADRTWVANRRLAELGSVGHVELEVSEAEVAKNRAEVAVMTATVGKCHVGAPFSGRIAEQKVREQQYVQPGQPLLEIIDDSVLELEFIAPSHWLAWLKAGTGLQVRIDETNRTYPAKVVRIGARVDPVSQSVKTAAAIDGHFPELIAGMSGKILLTPPAGE